MPITTVGVDEGRHVQVAAPVTISSGNAATRFSYAVSFFGPADGGGVVGGGGGGGTLSAAVAVPCAPRGNDASPGSKTGAAIAAAATLAGLSRSGALPA